MTITGPDHLLAVWEWGLTQPESGRALALHRAARPRAGTEELLEVPVGTRETDLYALRRTLFGDRMQVVAECAACGATVEFDLEAGALAAATPGRAPGGEPLRVTADGWVVEFRLPTVADLEAAATAGSPADARLALVTRCTVSALRDGQPADPRDLPDAVRRRLAEAAERADPAAETTLRVGCPECGESTPAELDIVDYLWAELDSWARDLLLDVHLLAIAYGWTEPEILALSPLRRRYYLELCADA